MTPIPTIVLGIDIGGSGIKAAPVDVATGALTAEKFVIRTPSQPDPTAMAGVLSRVLEEFDPVERIGMAFPGVVKNNEIRTAANLSASLIGCSASGLVDAPNKTVELLNDADAAGLAEARFGAASHIAGTVMMVTLGTGIGSALLTNGVLVPNTELGHLDIDGSKAEALAAARVKNAEGLEWNEWGDRLNLVLGHYARLLQPDLFVLGGGISNNFDLYEARLTLDTPVVPAKLTNEAGLIGAAIAGSDDTRIA